MAVHEAYQAARESDERALARCTDEELEIAASVLTRFLHDRSIVAHRRSGLYRADMLREDWVALVRYLYELGSAYYGDPGTPSRGRIRPH